MTDMEYSKDECIQAALNHLWSIIERNDERLSSGKRVNMMSEDQTAIGAAMSWLNRAGAN